MRHSYFHPTSSGWPSVARRCPLAGGLLAVMMTASLSAADWLKEEIERDWLRQEAVRQQGSVAGVTTESDAAGAVDGVKNGQWGFHTAQDASPWWQVDLGAAVALNRVLVYNSCHIPDRAAQLKVLLSDDGKAWREVYAHDGTAFRGAPDNKPLTVALGGTMPAAEARS